MSWILAAPIIIPFATAVLAFLFRAGPEGRWLSVVGSRAADRVRLPDGRGPAPRASSPRRWANGPRPSASRWWRTCLSAVMVVITGITGLAVAVYALADVDEAKERWATTPCSRCCWPGSAARS
jgi:multicomponent Na+:H+ antiporter subunit D